MIPTYWDYKLKLWVLHTEASDLDDTNLLRLQTKLLFTLTLSSVFGCYLLGHIRDSCQCRDLYVIIKASVRFIRPYVLADPCSLNDIIWN